MTRDVVPNAVQAMPGFAAGIDWSDTFLLLGIGACNFVALGAAAAIVIARRLPPIGTRRQIVYPPAPPAPPPPQLSTPTAPSDNVLSAQRSALVQGCVEVRGLVDDDMAADVLENALRLGGVTTFDPSGTPLDPRRHRVSHVLPAPAPQSDGIVARTLTPGYVDNGTVLQPAEVVVYRWGAR